MTRLSIIDVAILLAFAAWAIASGWRARHKASENLEEYFLAGRSLSGWSAGASMAATQFAADTPLLVTGLIATAGIFGLWRMWIYAVAFLLMGFVLAPCWRRARVITDAELAELRFASRPAAALRGVKAVYFGTVFNCTVLAMVLWAAKEIAEPFLPWHSWLPADAFASLEAVVTAVGVPFARDIAQESSPAMLASVYERSTDNLISLFLLVAVTLAYSTTGGLRGVVRTDIAQLGLMLFGTAAYALIVVDAAGGLTAMLATLADTYANPAPGAISANQLLAFTPSNARDATFSVLAVYSLQWLVQMNADGTGYLAQRSMACRSDADAKLAAVVFSGLQIVLRSLLWLPIGLGLLVLFPPAAGIDPGALQADREVSFVRGMAELLPAGVRGLMLTGMLAALASTLDTHLNWGASYWTNDLYARFYCRAWRGREPSPASLVWVARSSNLLILVVALAIMTRLSSIQTAWQASLLLGAGMGVLLVLRWFWWRINAWGELAAIGASMGLAPILLSTLAPDQEALRLLVMALGSTAAGLAASLLTAPEDEATLDAFYTKARPPGFWGPVARRCGRDPSADRRRLGRGLLATALAAFSMFSLLTGLGSWLVGSPAPVWWPGSAGACDGLVTAAGAALVPLWWRLGMAPDDT